MTNSIVPAESVNKFPANNPNSPAECSERDIVPYGDTRYGNVGGQQTLITIALGADEQQQLIEQSLQALMIVGEIHCLSATMNRNVDGGCIECQCFHLDPGTAAAACLEFIEAHSDCVIELHLNPIRASDEIIVGGSFEPGWTATRPSFRRWRRFVFEFNVIDENEIRVEHDPLSATLNRCELVASVLSENGWPKPTILRSQDSTFAVYELDAPVNEQVAEYLKDSLCILSGHYDTPSVAINTTTFDADSRCRLYGPAKAQSNQSDHTYTQVLKVPETSTAMEVSRLIDAATDYYWRRTHLQRFHARHGTPPRLTFEEFLKLCRNVRYSADGNAVASCPGHHDTQPSMSVSEGVNAQILAYCHAGCTIERICSALGIEPWQLFRANSQRTTATTIVKNAIPDANPELHDFASHCARTTSNEQLSLLATQLSVSVDSLRSLQIGWSPNHTAWTIPERRQDGSVVGIQFRDVNGNRWGVPGCHRGIILPREWSKFSGKVFLPEGMSDVAALLSHGLQAIGRPSAFSSSAILVAALQSTEMIPVVVGENDQKPDGRWPGREGAEKCAGELSAALQRPVQITYPPSNYKDVRAFITDTNGLGEFQ